MHLSTKRFARVIRVKSQRKVTKIESVRMKKYNAQQRVYESKTLLSCRCLSLHSYVVQLWLEIATEVSSDLLHGLTAHLRVVAVWSKQIEPFSKSISKYKISPNKFIGKCYDLVKKLCISSYDDK